MDVLRGFVSKLHIHDWKRLSKSKGLLEALLRDRPLHLIRPKVLLLNERDRKDDKFISLLMPFDAAPV